MRCDHEDFMNLFRATRCVLFTMTTISWIMLFSYTGVLNLFDREYYSHLTITFVFQTRNQNDEYIEAKSWQCQGWSTGLIHKEKNNPPGGFYHTIIFDGFSSSLFCQNTSHTKIPLMVFNALAEILAIWLGLTLVGLLKFSISWDWISCDSIS